MPATSTPKPARLRLLLALLLGFLHGWMAVSVSDRHSCVYDEPAHIVSGLAYWTEADFRLQPENGLLPQKLFGLPLLLSDDIHSPAMEGAHWHRADIWALGEELLYGSGNNATVILRRARLMNALVGAALVICITLWAGSICGLAGALTAGTLATFSPTLLAHSGFATSDTMGALGFLAATLAYWRLLHRITAARVVAAGATAAFFALSKYSAVLFPLVAAVLLVSRLCKRAPVVAGPHRLTSWKKLATLALGSFAAAALAWGVIWASYGFRYEARGPRAPEQAGFIKTWDQVLITQPVVVELIMADGGVPPNHAKEMRAGAVQHAVRFARDHRLLPEAWLYGFAFVERHSRFRLAYFCGEWSAVGWRSFFPVAYLIKSTPAEILLHVLGLAAVCGAWKANRRRFYRALPLLVPCLVYGAFAVSSGLNIGHRHLLPIYAFGALISGFAACSALERPRTGLRRVAALALASVLAGQILSSLAQRPSYLAYFNAAAGGSDQGYRYLADSSLDWGQDLPALRDWLRANPSRGPLHLAYFGTGSPAAHGIDALRFGDDAFDANPDRPLVPLLEPGRYAISATMWNRVYTKVRGPWTTSYEARYQALLSWIQRSARAGELPPARDPEGHPLQPKDLRQLLLQYEHLRFGRLLHQLAKRRPEARVAHNWFVFDLSADELRLALEGPLLNPPATSASARATNAAPPPTPDTR